MAAGHAHRQGSRSDFAIDLTADDDDNDNPGTTSSKNVGIVGGRGGSSGSIGKRESSHLSAAAATSVAVQEAGLAYTAEGDQQQFSSPSKRIKRQHAVYDATTSPPTSPSTNTTSNTTYVTSNATDGSTSTSIGTTTAGRHTHGHVVPHGLRYHHDEEHATTATAAAPPTTNTTDTKAPTTSITAPSTTTTTSSSTGTGTGTGTSVSVKWRPYYLLHTPQLPKHCNEGSLTIQDIMCGDFRSVVIMNYMIDMSWLLSNVPRLTNPDVAVCCIHGEKSSAITSTIIALGLYNWTVSEADLGPERFGTHHSKMILLHYDTGVRVVIMTANLIEDDFDYRTQGVFVQDFPLKQQVHQHQHHSTHSSHMISTSSDSTTSIATTTAATATTTSCTNTFEHDLVEYLRHVATKSADTQSALSRHISILCSKYDYSSAQVHIVASVPGRHSVSTSINTISSATTTKSTSSTTSGTSTSSSISRNRWGHLKLRACLMNAARNRRTSTSTSSHTNTTPTTSTSNATSAYGGSVDHIVCQYSSTGSMGKDEGYIYELLDSLSAGGSSSSRSSSSSSSSSSKVQLELIWPTAECVRTSLQGYASGGSLPCNSTSLFDNADTSSSSATSRGVGKLRLKEGFARHLCRWEGSPIARHVATPHMKSYCRYRVVSNSSSTSTSTRSSSSSSSSSRSSSSSSYIELDWFLLTSMNLSQAAWGVLQSNKTKLYIKSYEIGVLFIRDEITTSRRQFSCTPDHPLLGIDTNTNTDIDTTTTTTCTSDAPTRQGSTSGSSCSITSTSGIRCVMPTTSTSGAIEFPIPYVLPPSKYRLQQRHHNSSTSTTASTSTSGTTTSGTSTSDSAYNYDVPWCWDATYAQPDMIGRHGASSG